LESILKLTLKRQLPYLAGGTITGIFMTYYYGLLFSIIVNSVMWFVISTVINKYYWHYTGFKDELYLVSKYIIHRKKNNSKNIQDIGIVDGYNGKENNNNKKDSLLKNADDDNTRNNGSPLKL
jgi:predicted tellurium resistance membrane protein TerC